MVFPDFGGVGAAGVVDGVDEPAEVSIARLARGASKERARSRVPLLDEVLRRLRLGGDERSTRKREGKRERGGERASCGEHRSQSPSQGLRVRRASDDIIHTKAPTRPSARAHDP